MITYTKGIEVTEGSLNGMAYIKGIKVIEGYDDEARDVGCVVVVGDWVRGG